MNARRTILKGISLSFMLLAGIAGCSHNDTTDNLTIREESSSLYLDEKNYVSDEVIVKFKTVADAQLADDSDVATTTVTKKIKNKNVQFRATGVLSVNGLLKQKKSGSRKAQFKSALSALPSKQKGLYNIYKVKVENKNDAGELISELKKDSNVEYAEPNYIHHVNYVPVDTYYSKQWSHQLSNAEEGWDITKGSSDVVVAVIDTGVDYNHTDLAANIWHDAQGNPGADFVDVDIDALEAVGYQRIDGEDYSGIDNDPMDVMGHGTHCSGIIAAAENGTGIVGVAPNVKIMPVRAGYAINQINPDGSYKKTGGLTTESIIQAVNYAAANGADVISMSYGSYSYSQAEYDAMKAAYDKDIVLLAAAGNGATDSLSYPAAYDCVISVASVGPGGTPASYSNYGYSVDISAPGGDADSSNYTTNAIYSTVPGNAYAYMQGTSMACPYAAGVAALVRSKNGALTNAQVKTVLESSAVSTWSATYYGMGYLNISAALSMADSVPSVTATISSPEESDIIEKAVTVSGNANGSYQVMYGKGRYPSYWNTVSSGSSVSDGVLGTIDFSSFDEGVYTFKLSNYVDGFRKTDYVTVSNINGIKTGWKDEIHRDLDLRGMPPVTADLNNDGKSEVIVGDPTSLYVFNADGSLYSSKWPVNCSAINYLGWADYSVGDVTGDSNKEIVVKLRFTSELLVYSHTGDLLYRTNMPQIDYGYSKPILADINGDGKNEIILNIGSPYPYFSNGTASQQLPNIICIYSGTLNLTKSWTIDTGKIWDWGCTVADLDNDGTPEIITDSIGSLSDKNSYIDAWTINGTKKWSYQCDGYGFYQTLLSVDLNGDRTNEVIYAANNQVIALSASGTVLSGFPVEVEGASYPQCADINLDGSMEIIVSAYDSSTSSFFVRILSSTGETVKDIPVDAYLDDPMVIADIDGDASVELVINSEKQGVYDTAGYDEVYAYNIDTGTAVSGFPKRLCSAPGWRVFDNSPALADLDADGQLELICGQQGLRVYALSGKYDPYKLMWPQFGQNANHTASYDNIFSSNFNQLYFRGTPNTWGASGMVLVADNVWRCEAKFTDGDSNGGPRFKFDVYGDWNYNFGDNNADGDADQSGSDIAVTQGVETSVITFNDSTKKYTVTQRAITDGYASVYFGYSYGVNYALIGMTMNLYRNGVFERSCVISGESYSSPVCSIKNLAAGIYTLTLDQTKGTKRYSGSATFTIDEDHLYGNPYLVVSVEDLVSGSAVITFAGHSGIESVLSGMGVSVSRNGESYGSYTISTNSEGAAVVSLSELPAGSYALTLKKQYNGKWYEGETSFTISSSSSSVSVSCGAYESTVENMYLRGTFNTWGSSLMKLVADNTWQGSATFASGDANGGPRFKFDVYGDWSYNFGDTNADGYADQSGSDIAVESDATYVISFNIETKAYSAVKQ